MSDTESKEKIIKIKGCNECPYLKSDRYSYCSKRYKDCPEAYRDGGYAEYASEIPWLYKNCPLEDTPVLPVCDNKPDKCPHCAFIGTLGDVQSNREYWLITEIFVHLHNGHDYCDWNKK